MARQERIACSAVAIVNGDLTSYVIVEEGRLVMDTINHLMKTRPDLEVGCDLFFITTLGRVLDAYEAFTVAFDANQIRDEAERVRPPLTEQHLRRL